MICKVDHIVITTSNVDACTAFYKALGFRAENTGTRWELFSGDFKINVHCKGHEPEPKAAHVQTGSADFCMEIDGSIAKCKEQLIEKGIKIELGIVPRQGARGEMHSIYMRDPDENLIELCSYE
ncbi:MAG: VOC family protein [Oscillospiraceae bacterium]